MSWKLVDFVKCVYDNNVLLLQFLRYFLNNILIHKKCGVDPLLVVELDAESYDGLEWSKMKWRLRGIWPKPNGRNII